jgi:hypothetical protein
LSEGASGTGDGVLLGDGLGDAVGDGTGEFWTVGVGAAQLTTKSDNTITPTPVRIIAPSLIRVLIFITTFLTNLSPSISNRLIHLNAINHEWTIKIQLSVSPLIFTTDRYYS